MAGTCRLSIAIIAQLLGHAAIRNTPACRREALKTFTARQLRLMFTMQPWGKEMTFGNTLKEEMSVKEHIFKHFFQNVDVLLRRHTPILAWEVSF